MNKSPRQKSSAAASLLVSLALLLAILGLYVGGYFWPSESTAVYRFEKTWIRRSFGNRWLAWAYQPAAWIESRVHGRDIQADTVYDAKPALQKPPAVAR
jgi:hypothetical protein